MSAGRLSFIRWKMRTHRLVAARRWWRAREIGGRETLEDLLRTLTRCCGQRSQLIKSTSDLCKLLDYLHIGYGPCIFVVDVYVAPKLRFNPRLWQPRSMGLVSLSWA